ncbi:carboxylesterase/lipase family protein [Alteromonas lipolytica]|uniref:Carboxylic ester hydrolase n=1 Tax=Alteromonas lipolytica TaxID=1856405 RepID=A0A1E8FJ17_9ALTE|nr:carboxylesterase family protein [Alteromonas lipolytica]OFI35443.1 hypothetical protein BFC17_11790 [Alteromonas lipolytica]GGF76285.1 carboxylic ester hydrolase [Alteromonas lipolytica]
MNNTINHHRRKLLIAAGISVPALSLPFNALAGSSAAPVANTAQGRLRGLNDNGVLIFKGVPYAGSVSGAANRFKAPPPPEGWSGVRDATRFGAPAWQKSQPFGFDQPDMNEDCLFLNVWTPALDGAKRPVMVYQHGGGFVIGSGAAPWQDGAALAREHDVVVVQSNHRLGLMGYLYLGGLLGEEYQGNQGLQDLVAALKWVNQNIAEFGGDPDNVMIFGESGGGGKTSALYGMPSAAPYFAKASIESPIGPGHQTPEQATEITREVMRRVNVTDPRKLLTLPADVLIKAQVGGTAAQTGGAGPADASKTADGEIMFWPLIDGKVLPEEPFSGHAPAVSANKPLIVGTCKDESVFFYQGDKSVFSLTEAGLHERLKPILGSHTERWINTFKQSRPTATPSELFIAITTAKPWRAHHLRIAEAKAKQGTAKVYSYILDYNSPVPVRGTDFPQGSPHASDIAMKFNTAAQFGPKDEARLKTATNMSTLWANFARHSVPSAPGQPEWRAYSLDERDTLIIDAECRLQKDPESLERQFFAQEPHADTEVPIK